MQPAGRILLLLLTPFFAYTQTKLLVKGKVTDRTSQSPLEYAMVAAMVEGDVLLSGSVTNPKGEFELILEQPKPFMVRVKYLSYKTYDTLISNWGDKREIAISIQLAPNLQQLDEVIVNAEKLTTNVQLDKQQFTASQFGNTVTGTAADLMQRLPSVTINTEGNVMMRGNAEFLVTVNGKFTNQSPADVLSQLPANTIESIEILSSPSARYDAEGKAGIINIVTKKNATEGWGISGNANLSSINPERYGTDLTIYRTSQKWSSFITGNYRRYDIDGSRNGEISTLYQDTVTHSLWTGERPLMEWVHGVRAGTTFTPSEHSIFNAGVYYGYKRNDRIANMHYQEFSTTEPPLNLYQTIDSPPDRLFYNQNLFGRTGKFFTANTDFTHSFANNNNITLTAIYEHSVLGGPLRNQDNDEISGELTLQERSDERSPLDAWRLQADYSIFLNKNMRLETGYQWRTVSHEGDFDFERLNIATGIWEIDPEFYDRMNLKQAIHAGYVQLNGNYKMIKYSAGLRAEQMNRKLTHDLGTAPYLLNQVNLFPSLNALWQLKKEQQLKVGYSRRIDRPTTKALSPFKNHRHSESIEIGDPNLLPELTDIIELGYIRGFDKLNLSLTAYHTAITNKVFRVNDNYNRITLIRTYTNAGNTNSSGLEFTSDWQIAKWWRWYVSGNIYHLMITQIENAETDKTESVNFNLNGNFSFQLHKKVKLQWDAIYISRTVTAQGEDSDLFLSNIGLKYTYNKKLSADILFQNIFDSNRQTIMTKSKTFYTSTEYIKYDRILQLSVSYRFNEIGKAGKTIKTEYGEKDF